MQTKHAVSSAVSPTPAVAFSATQHRALAAKRPSSVSRVISFFYLPAFAFAALNTQSPPPSSCILLSGLCVLLLYSPSHRTYAYLSFRCLLPSKRVPDVPAYETANSSVGVCWCLALVELLVQHRGAPVTQPARIHLAPPDGIMLRPALRTTFRYEARGEGCPSLATSSRQRFGRMPRLCACLAPPSSSPLTARDGRTQRSAVPYSGRGVKGHCCFPIPCLPPSALSFALACLLYCSTLLDAVPVAGCS